MQEKRLVDSHLENFAFESMKAVNHDKWINELDNLLTQYRIARGR